MNDKVENISYGALLIGLGILALLNVWWPGLLIVLGVFFTLKNALSKNYFKMLISALSFAGAYICVQYPFMLSWNLVLPFALFAIGAEKLFKEFVLRRKKS